MAGGFAMPIIATDIPSDFVDYLTDPGLPVYDMNIPLTQYVCSDPSFGGNAEAAQVIGYANQKIFVDEISKTRISSQTRNIGRLTTGQGYPDDFILLMEHMTDNIDKMRSAPELKNKEYFRDPNLDVEAILKKMVEKKVFGMDCIGFVSQYLVYAGVWQEYKTYYPADYRREFKPVKSLSEVQRLCLVIWNNYHIGIIDDVDSYDSDTDEILVDICQSSSGEAKGPQTNCGVTLRKSPGDAYEGAQKFKIFRAGSPAMPVKAPVYICKMPGLVWQGDLASD
jgi:hypothetical protein